MKWIKTSEQLPAQNTWVLVADKDGDVIMATITDVNSSYLDSKGFRKHPEKLEWESMFSGCCDSDYEELEYYPYWSEIPEGPKEQE